MKKLIQAIISVALITSVAKADEPSMWVEPAILAGIGGSLGYASSSNSTEQQNNAIIGSLVGLGIGYALGYYYKDKYDDAYIDKITRLEKTINLYQMRDAQRAAEGSPTQFGVIIHEYVPPTQDSTGALRSGHFIERSVNPSEGTSVGY